MFKYCKSQSSITQGYGSSLSEKRENPAMLLVKIVPLLLSTSVLFSHWFPV
jgi:hypothetical protein